MFYRLPIIFSRLTRARYHQITRKKSQVTGPCPVPVTGRGDCTYHIHFLVLFLFTFIVNAHLGFELFFSIRIEELFNSIEIEIVIVSNNRAVPCMGLGSRLYLPFWGSAIVFNYSCNY